LRREQPAWIAGDSLSPPGVCSCLMGAHDEEERNEIEPDRDATTERSLAWTVEETGRLLGISRAHAYELVARGELPHLRLGRRVVVPKYAIEALLARAASGS